MPFTIGQNVGPYRILEQLGQGGMATVYKAYHAALDRYVAIKVLHPAFREDTTFLARFTREARVVARLEHPNIVPIYDFAELDGQSYLVMKYIEGETLKAHLAQRPLTAEEAVRIVQAVGSALAFAHGKGILHRDIKPSNILLTPDGGIYLADFGLARIAQSGESTLSSDMLLGTPHYISPEQAQGLKNLDEGTDIYSFGVVLYEISVGRVPFNADTPFSIIHDHIFTPLPLPSAINSKVPPAVERVLLKALAKERKDRYADVDTLVKAFVSAVHATSDDHQPISSVTTRRLPPTEAPVPAAAPPAPKPPPPGRMNKKKYFWERLPNWAVVLGAVFACLCCCVMTWLVIRDIRDNGEDTPARNETLAIVQPAVFTEGPTPQETPDIPEDAREAWQHLDAGLNLRMEGKEDEAEAEIQIALQMMPSERSGVILLAVQRLSGAGDWMNAGAFVMKGLEPNKRDTALRLAAMEVFYHVAADEAGNAMLEPLVTEYPNWATALAARARWMMTYGDLREAERVLQKARENVTDEEGLYVKAVDGEWLCVSGKTAEGIQTLQSVMDSRETPPWLRAEMERMIQRWQ